MPLLPRRPRRAELPEFFATATEVEAHPEFARLTFLVQRQGRLRRLAHAVLPRSRARDLLGELRRALASGDGG